MFIILLLVLQIILGNVGSSVVHRIVNGYKASIEDFPFIVALQKEGKRQCGGTIIAPDFVVTAAHCLLKDPAARYSVIAGTANLWKKGVERRVVEITIHPDYDKVVGRVSSADLAVIRLESPFDYVKGKIENVNLPEYSKSVPLTWGKVAGWGKTYDPFANRYQLRAVDLEIYHQELCQFLPYYPPADNMFCAGHSSELKSPCHGDSGGPFVIGNTLYGVVSGGAGVPCVKGPGVYTNIPYFVDWIKEVAKIPN